MKGVPLYSIFGQDVSNLKSPNTTNETKYQLRYDNVHQHIGQTSSKQAKTSHILSSIDLHKWHIQTQFLPNYVQPHNTPDMKSQQ